MKRIIFSYIGLLLGLIMGNIFFHIYKIIKDPYYPDPIALAAFHIILPIYLLCTMIPFTIFGAMLLIFSKRIRWQIPCSKIQNMEIGFFYAVLWTIAGWLNALKRVMDWLDNFLWSALHSHMLFVRPIFTTPEDFDFFIGIFSTFLQTFILYSLPIFLLVVIVDYFVLIKIPYFSVKG